MHIIREIKDRKKENTIEKIQGIIANSTFPMK